MKTYLHFYIILSLTFCSLTGYSQKQNISNYDFSPPEELTVHMSRLNVHLIWSEPNGVYLNESFEGGVIPEGWTMQYEDTTQTNWTVQQGGTFGQPPAAADGIYNAAFYGSSAKTWLISPPLDIRSANFPALSFSFAIPPDTVNESLKIKYKDSYSDQWHDCPNLNSNSNEWKNILLSDFENYKYSSEFYLAFVAQANGGKGVYLDNIVLKDYYPARKNFIGYNVYRDNVKLNSEPLTSVYYDDKVDTYDVYNYSVTAVYSDGESEMEGPVTADLNEKCNCINPVYLNYEVNCDTTIRFYLNAPIWQGNCEYDSLSPIPWRGWTTRYLIDGEIIPVNFLQTNYMEYSYIYDARDLSRGSHILTVDDGFYSPTFNISSLLYFSYCFLPEGLTASLENNSVLLNWYKPLSLYSEYEIIYDDSIAENALASHYSGDMHALRFTPDGYPCRIKGGSVNIYDGTWPSGVNLQPFEIAVFDDDGSDGLPGTELGRIGVIPTHYNWVDFDLSSLNLEIYSGDFYIAKIQGGDYPNCVPVSIDESNPVYRSYSKYFSNGQDWKVAPYHDFMIRALVESPTNYKNSSENNTHKIVLNTDNDKYAVSMKPPKLYDGKPAKYKNYRKDVKVGTVEIIGYNVYRNGEMINDVVVKDTSYLDNNISLGRYEYQVSTVYKSDESRLCEPVIIEICPPATKNLRDSVNKNIVHLEWDYIIDDKSFLGFNVYRNNEKINLDTIHINTYEDTLHECGTYWYSITTLYDACESEIVDSVVANIITLGNDDFIMDKFIKIHPNPAKEIVNIQSPVDIDNIRIFDVFGQKNYDEAIKNKNFTINTSSFKKGIYLLKFQIKNNVVTKKLIIR